MIEILKNCHLSTTFLHTKNIDVRMFMSLELKSTRATLLPRPPPPSAPPLPSDIHRGPSSIAHRRRSPPLPPPSCRAQAVLRRPLPLRDRTNFVPCSFATPFLGILPQVEMNFANLSAIYRRVGLKELLTGGPAYTGASDASGGQNLMFRRWATKKSGGSTKNGKDSNPKFLGVKKFGGERVIPGNIIVRQRGTRFHPGDYVGIGKDHTLYALKEGNVRFERHKLSGRKYVHVDPKEGHVLHPIYANIKYDFAAKNS